MQELILILLSTFLISAISFIGLVAIVLKNETLNKIIKYLIALSAGSLIGTAFLHLLPQTSRLLDETTLFTTVLISFVIFFVLERVIHWRHSHVHTGEKISFGYLNLFADALHNFSDGAVIAAAFLVDVKTGILTTIAVMIHEIPQEIGDFGVLIYSGWTKKNALLANFFSAATAILGGIFGYYISTQLSTVIPYLLAFAAGGFIYIGASDLLPEIREEKNLRKSVEYFSVFILGLALMYLLTFIE